MHTKSVEDLYNDGLKEILYAERKILQALKCRLRRVPTSW